MKNHNSQERGAILFVVIVGMASIFAMMMLVSVMIKQTQANVEMEANYRGMAINFAEAGIVESLSWFRRNQPVDVDDSSPYSHHARMVFMDVCTNPECGYETAHVAGEPASEKNCPVCGAVMSTPDSNIPEIGVVRVFQLGANRWGRYEVWKQDVRDKTSHYSFGAQDTGAIWEVKSVGMVYETNRDDPDVAGRKLKEIKANVVLSAEFRKLTIRIPQNAGIISSRGDYVRLGSRVRFVASSGGSTFGVCYPNSTGSVDNNGAEFFGFSNNLKSIEPENLQIGVYDIFSVRKEELANLADLYAETVADLPDPLPDMYLIFIDGDAAFDSTTRLRGSGILFVDGNLSLTGTGHSYNGLVCVTGTFVNQAVSTFYGCVMAGLEMTSGGSHNQVVVEGIGADFAEVYYDPNILNQVQAYIGQYRMLGSPKMVPNETWMTGHRNKDRRDTLPDIH